MLISGVWKSDSVMCKYLFRLFSIFSVTPHNYCPFSTGPFPVSEHLFPLYAMSNTSPVQLCVMDLMIFGVKWRAPQDSKNSHITWSHVFSLLTVEKSSEVILVLRPPTMARGWGHFHHGSGTASSFPSCSPFQDPYSPLRFQRKYHGSSLDWF